MYGSPLVFAAILRNKLAEGPDDPKFKRAGGFSSGSPENFRRRGRPQRSSRAERYPLQPLFFRKGGDGRLG